MPAPNLLLASAQAYLPSLSFHSATAWSNALSVLGLTKFASVPVWLSCCLCLLYIAYGCLSASIYLTLTVTAYLRLPVCSFRRVCKFYCLSVNLPASACL